MKHTFKLSLLGLSLLAAPAFAASEKKLSERAQNATRVFQEWTDLNIEHRIPANLLEAAECLVVIPSLWKVAWGVGGRRGAGLASCRSASTWSNPVFFSVTGASLGFQLGAKSSDVVLVFTRDNASERLSQANFTLGADASIAVGPVGRSAEASTDWILSSEIFSYSRDRGLFAGVSLQGAVLKPVPSDNKKVYGRYIPMNEQMGIREAAPAMLRDFVRTLDKHTL